MKPAFSIVFLFFGFLTCKNINNDYSYKILEHRKSIDDIFNNDKTSPLMDADREKFKGLSYFDVDKNYLVNALVEKFDSFQLVEINHTLNRKYPFIKWGKAHFKLNNDSCHLTIYLSANSDTTTNTMVFIPFKDQTNGSETYAGGRYLDVEMPGRTALIDFNLAYNPNCAYSDNWSCPLVPDENVLPIAIKAGVKSFDRGH